MLIKDSFTLHAPRDVVWALLQDVERMATCVPGAETMPTFKGFPCNCGMEARHPKGAP